MLVFGCGRSRHRSAHVGSMRVARLQRLGMVAAAMMACLCSGLEWVCVVFSAAAKSGEGWGDGGAVGTGPRLGRGRLGEGR